MIYSLQAIITFTICLPHYNCLSALFHVHFIKPVFISKASIKSSTQSETLRDTCDGFTILINMLREVLPQTCNNGTMIEPNTELEKLCITKSTAFSMLASNLIIAQRTLSHCKENFPPHKADKIFLKLLSKCVNYDVEANLELAKLNACILKNVNTKTKLHVHNATDLTRCYKIMQHDNNLMLKLG